MLLLHSGGSSAARKRREGAGVHLDALRTGYDLVGAPGRARPRVSAPGIFADTYDGRGLAQLADPPGGAPAGVGGPDVHVEALGEGEAQPVGK